MVTSYNGDSAIDDNHLKCKNKPVSGIPFLITANSCQKSAFSSQL